MDRPVISNSATHAPHFTCLPTAFVQGLPINLASHEEVLEEIARVIDLGDAGHYIAITNTESMYHGQRLEGHRNYLRGADISLCDGVGVSLAGYSWGHRIKRFTGPTLQLKCCQYGASRGWRHFLYGGKQGVAETLARRLEAKYPGATICGTHCPPFRALTSEEDERVVNLINQSEPDIVWVGLGLLKQEQWIAEHLGRIKAPWMIGVGAAFDYHSGAVPWAPAPIRALGLEWAFMWAMQPKVRTRRYLLSAIYVAQTFTIGLLTAQFLRTGQNCSSASTS